MKHTLLLALVLALASGVAYASNTGGGLTGDPPLPIDGTWQYGEVWRSGEVQTWSYDSPSVPVIFQVTDAYLTGDYFDVYLDGGWVFSTPDVPETGEWEGDFDICYADPRWSSGGAMLPAGTHDIDVQFWVDAGLPAGYGVKATAVPEPASLALLSVGGLGALLPLRRRKKS